MEKGLCFSTWLTVWETQSITGRPCGWERLQLTVEGGVASDITSTDRNRTQGGDITFRAHTLKPVYASYVLYLKGSILWTRCSNAQVWGLGQRQTSLLICKMNQNADLVR